MAAANGSERQILDWLGGQRPAMLALLETLVNTDSGTYDKAGVDAVGGAYPRFPRRATASPLRSRPHEVRRRHHARPSAMAANRPILLMGHRDTVFPKGEPARRPFNIEDGRAYGPGVADMKAGLVMNCFVLAAFKQFGGAPAPLVGAVHRRRGDRLAVLAAGDRGGGARAPAPCSTPSPGGRAAPW